MPSRSARVTTGAISSSAEGVTMATSWSVGVIRSTHKRIGLLHLAGEFVLCAQRDQLTVVDDAHAVRELLSLFHVVGGV